MKVTVDTPNGTLEGREEQGVQVFRGIPYAAPPVGELRFRAPEPRMKAPPWIQTMTGRRFASQRGVQTLR